MVGTDNSCWHKWWDGTAWYGCESLGGLFIGDISAVSWGPERIDLFARGMDNAVYHKSFVRGKGWLPSISEWAYLGGTGGFTCT